MILYTVCLCLGSLFLCEVFDPLIASDERWYMAYTDGGIQQSHLDEHDDDFVLVEEAVSGTGAVSISENRSNQIPVVSHSVSPQLPPPKAA
jgi:hypothetical protein